MCAAVVAVPKHHPCMRRTAQPSLCVFHPLVSANRMSHNDRDLPPNDNPNPNPRRPAKAPAKAKKKKPRRPVEVEPPPEPNADRTDESPGESDDLSPFAPGTAPGRRILSDEQWATAAAHYKLSGQHIAVIKHFFDGESGKGVAYLMGVEESCVRTYIRRIYAKLGVSGQIPMASAILELFLDPERGHTPPDADQE